MSPASRALPDDESLSQTSSHRIRPLALPWKKRKLSWWRHYTEVIFSLTMLPLSV